MICNSISIRLGTLGAVEVLCLTLLFASASLAQPAAFTPVDQAISDVSPLEFSLHDLQPDAGPPIGFERVYTSPDYPGQFLRVNGALVAAFPKSQYVADRNGIFPILPENTTFYIGPSLESFLKAPEIQPPDSVSPLYINARINNLATALMARDVKARIPHQLRKGPPPQTIWSSELHRQERVARWLHVAANADSRRD